MPVLVGFVPTPEGEAALRRAVLECQLRGTDLIVVSAEHHAEHAADPTASPDLSAEWIRTLCADLDVSELPIEIRRNRNAYEPADDVLSVAEETEAELIVIGLRRRTAVGKLILGGSAQRILLDASCAVLAVKGERVSGVDRTGRAGDTQVGEGGGSGNGHAGENAADAGGAGGAGAAETAGVREGA